jgi:hypothetical protein
VIAWGIAVLLFIGVVIGVRTFMRRQEAQRKAHDARLAAMAQTYLAAAKKKAAAEAAAKAATTNVPSQPVTPSTAAVREERDCPFCAEPILKKAKVCKHCGREVQPLA